MNEWENKALPYGRKGHLITTEGMTEVRAHRSGADGGRHRQWTLRPWKEV